MMSFWARLGWNISLTVNQIFGWIGNNVASDTKERIAKEDEGIAERIFSSPMRLRRNFTVDNVIEVISHYSAKEKKRKSLIEDRTCASDQGGEAAAARLPLPEKPSIFWTNLKVLTTQNWQDENRSDEDKIVALSNIFANAHILSEKDRIALTKRFPDGPNRLALQNQHDQTALLQLFELAYAFPEKFSAEILNRHLNSVIEKAKDIVSYPGLAQHILRSKIFPLPLQQALCDYFILTPGVQIPDTLKPDLIPYTFNSHRRYQAAEQKNVYKDSRNNLTQESKEYVTKSLKNKNPRKPKVLRGLVEYVLTYYVDLSQPTKDIFFENALSNTYTAETAVTSDRLNSVEKVKIYLFNVTPAFLAQPANYNRLKTMLTGANNAQARETFLTIVNDFSSNISSIQDDNDVKRMKIALNLLDDVEGLRQEAMETRSGIFGWGYKYAAIRDASLYNEGLIKYYLLNASPQFFNEDLETVKALLQPRADNTAARKTFLTLLNDLFSHKTFNKDDNDIKRMEIALPLLDQVGDLSREASETRSGIFGLGYQYEALRDIDLRNEEFIKFYLLNATPEFFNENRAKLKAILASPNNAAARQAFLTILNKFYSDTSSPKNDNEIKRMEIAHSVLNEIDELNLVATRTRGGLLGWGYQFASLRDDSVRSECLINFYLLNASPQFFRNSRAKAINLLSNEANTAARQAFLNILNTFYMDANPDSSIAQNLRMQEALSILNSVPTLRDEAMNKRGRFFGIGFKYAALREKIPMVLDEVPPEANNAPAPPAPAITSPAVATSPVEAERVAGERIAAVTAAISTRPKDQTPPPTSDSTVSSASDHPAPQPTVTPSSPAHTLSGVRSEQIRSSGIGSAIPPINPATASNMALPAPLQQKHESPDAHSASRNELGDSNSSIGSSISGSHLSNSTASISSINTTPALASGSGLVPSINQPVTTELLRQQELKANSSQTLAGNSVYKQLYESLLARESKNTYIALNTRVSVFLENNANVRELMAIAVNAGDHIAASAAIVLFTFQQNITFVTQPIIKLSKEDIKNIYQRHSNNKEVMNALLNYLYQCSINAAQALEEADKRNAKENIDNAYDFARSLEGSTLSANGNSFAKTFYSHTYFPRRITEFTRDDLEKMFNSETINKAAVEEFFEQLRGNKRIIESPFPKDSADAKKAAANYNNVVRHFLISENGKKFADTLFSDYHHANVIPAEQGVIDTALLISSITEGSSKPPHFYHRHFNTLLDAAVADEREAKTFFTHPENLPSVLKNKLSTEVLDLPVTLSHQNVPIHKDKSMFSIPKKSGEKPVLLQINFSNPSTKLVNAKAFIAALNCTDILSPDQLENSFILIRSPEAQDELVNKLQANGIANADSILVEKAEFDGDINSTELIYMTKPTNEDQPQPKILIPSPDKRNKDLYEKYGKNVSFMNSIGDKFKTQDWHILTTASIIIDQISSLFTGIVAYLNKSAPTELAKREMEKLTTSAQAARTIGIFSATERSAQEPQNGKVASSPPGPLLRPRPSGGNGDE